MTQTKSPPKSPPRAPAPRGPDQGGVADAAGLTKALAAQAGPLAERRRAALQAFQALGLPTPRHEAWRFTPSAVVGQGAPAAAPPRLPRELEAEADARLAELDLGGPRLVVVNGRLDAARSRGAELRPAASRLALLGRAAETGEAGRGLTALNLANLGPDDGAALSFAGEAHAGEDRAPVQLVHFVAPSAQGPVVHHPRTVVSVAAGGRATLVELVVPLGAAAATGEAAPAALVNAVVDVVLEAGARLEHVRVHLEAEGTAWVGAVDVALGQGAVYQATAFQLGGPLQRTDWRLHQEADGCDVTLRGLQLARGAQAVDAHVDLDHAQPHGESRQLWKTVVQDGARAVLDAKIVVRPRAQKASAHLQTKSLLLSDRASVQAIPRLEILADDVKCSHGATVGQLDPAQLFYLRSRGLGEAEARALLVEAFGAEVCAAAPAALRPWLERLVQERLRGRS